MKISGSGINYPIGKKSGKFSINAKVLPNKKTGSFSISTKEGLNSHVQLLFNNGKITDHNGNFLKTYNNSTENIKLDFDLDSDLYDFYSNGLPLAGGLSSNNFNPDTVNIESTDVSVDYSFDVYSNESALFDFSPSLVYSNGYASGTITNNAPGDLIINSITVPTYSGVTNEIYDTGSIPPASLANFTFNVQGGDIDGQNYAISFDTNYGVFSNVFQIDDQTPFEEIYNLEVTGPSVIDIENGKGEAIYLISLDTNIQPSGLEVSLEYVDGNGPVNESIWGSGVGTGIFTGTIKKSGFLYSNSATGHVTASNGFNSNSSLISAPSKSRLVYATGSNSFLYKVWGKGKSLDTITQKSWNTGDLDLIITPSGSGKFAIRSYPEEGFVTGEYVDVYGYLTGEYVVEVTDEADLGVYYIDDTIIGTGYVLASGVIQGSQSITGTLQKRVQITHDYNKQFTGLIYGFVDVEEGTASFLNQWDLKTGDFYTGDMLSYSDSSYVSGNNYVNPNVYQGMSIGENYIYAKVNYVNNFKSLHSDIAQLKVRSNGQEFVLNISGRNSLKE